MKTEVVLHRSGRVSVLNVLPHMELYGMYIF
jgi:hypothetical protein